MSLKIKSLSLKINFVHLFSGGTFGAGHQTKWNILNFYIKLGPAQKLLTQNILTKFFFKDKDLIFKLINNYYNIPINKYLIEC